MDAWIDALTGLALVCIAFVVGMSYGRQRALEEVRTMVRQPQMSDATIVVTESMGPIQIGHQ